MRRWLLLAAAATLAALASAPALATDGKDAPDEHRAKVSSRNVTFTVQNVNRSRLACATDGKTYRVRGTIVGPRGSLDDAETATLYLHGLEQGKFFWTTKVQGQSYAQRLASRGHVSVVIDRLGYDASGKPIGTDSCLGGQADIASQIVDQLRSGDYATPSDDRDAPRFSRIILAGHSVGGLLTELTAHSFDNVDGIVVMSYSSTVMSDAARAAAAYNAGVCAAGGESTEGSAPGGYAFFSSDVTAYRAAFFLSADPETIDLGTELRNRNPCGDTATFAAGSALNAQRAGLIDVPALVVIGREDALFPPPAGPSEAASLTGAKSVRLRELSPSSHGVTLEATAPQLAAEVSDWLDDQGFGPGGEKDGRQWPVKKVGRTPARR